MTAISVLPAKGCVSQTIPHLNLVWDSTLLAAAKKCGRYYFYRHVRDLVPLDQNHNLIFGHWLHKGMEFYDQLRLDPELSEQDCQRALVREFIPLVASWPDIDPIKNRRTLIRTLVDYASFWWNDPCETVILANGKPATELTFRYDSGIQAPDGTNYQFAGHIDRLVRFENSIYFMDRKTTKRPILPKWFAGFNPTVQFRGYARACRIYYGVDVAGGMIDGIQIEADGTNFKRWPIDFHPSILDDAFQSDISAIQTQAKWAAENIWPQNETACHNYFGCEFIDICTRPTAVREDLISGKFTHESWDPTVAR